MAEVYYDIELFDQYGRLLKPLLANEAADGSGTWRFPVVDSNGILQVNDTSGTAPTPTNTAYSVSNTAVDDTARQISPTPLVIKSATIKCSERPQRIGDSLTQNYLLEVGQSVSVDSIDLSTLYAINDKTGRNGVITIFGTVA